MAVSSLNHSNKNEKYKKIMEKWKFYKLALIARFKVCVDQFIRVSFGAYLGV